MSEVERRQSIRQMSRFIGNFPERRLSGPARRNFAEQDFGPSIYGRRVIRSRRDARSMTSNPWVGQWVRVYR